jgi:hypothetical protein
MAYLDAKTFAVNCGEERGARRGAAPAWPFPRYCLTFAGRLPKVTVTVRFWLPFTRDS